MEWHAVSLKTNSMTFRCARCLWEYRVSSHHPFDFAWERDVVSKYNTYRIAAAHEAKTLWNLANSPCGYVGRYL